MFVSSVLAARAWTFSLRPVLSHTYLNFIVQVDLSCFDFDCHVNFGQLFVKLYLFSIFLFIIWCVCENYFYSLISNTMATGKIK